MVQVKKKVVRDAIVHAAFELFSERGYRRTKLADIAARAQVGVGNVYSYFPSKLHVLYEVYRPWLVAQIAALERRLDDCETPHDKVRCILMGIWHDIPTQNLGLANSLMEALATAEAGQGKVTDLLPWVERRTTAMLKTAIPAERLAVLDGDRLSNLWWMAYDGFVINRRIGDVRDIAGVVDVVCGLLLGTEPGANTGRTARSGQHSGKQRRQSRRRLEP